MMRKFLTTGEYLTRDESPDEIRAWALLVAGISVLLSCTLTTFLIGEHLTAYNKPEEQKWIIGCIFMVPMYAVCSFLSLWQPHLDTISNLARNCYEAYALYSFCMYLIACLGGEERAIEKLSGRSTLPGPHTPLLEGAKKHPRGYSRIKEELKHPLPMNLFLRPWVPGPEFYVTIKVGIVQYMVLKTACAIIQLVLDPWRLYGEGDFDWNTGYPYMTIVLNFSQCWAIYCLVMFYHATWQYLVPIKPLGKFISIKSIIFVTWWQGVIIALAFAFGFLRPPPDDITQGIAFQNALQDFLTALEMSVAAIAHIYCFPATPYQNLGKAESLATQCVAVLDNMAAMDAPVDPEEVIASEEFGHQSFLPPPGREVTTSFTASIHDVLFSGGKEVVTDVQKTVHVAVEPLNRSFQETLDLLNSLSGRGLRIPRGNQQVKDDSFLPSGGGMAGAGSHGATASDDPGAGGSVSDSGTRRARRKKKAYASVDSTADRHDPGQRGGGIPRSPQRDPLS